MATHTKHSLTMTSTDGHTFKVTLGRRRINAAPGEGSVFIGTIPVAASGYDRTVAGVLGYWNPGTLDDAARENLAGKLVEFWGGKAAR